MNDWIKCNDKLPKDRKTVNIKDVAGNIHKNVLFSEGRFWKVRKAPNVGQTWLAVEWQPIEKTGKKPDYEKAVLGGHEER